MMTKKLEVDQAKLDRLEELEEIVETVQDPMGKGLAALVEILREELYKVKGYKTEEAYLEKRWGRFAGRTLYHKQACLRVAQSLGDALPEGTREAHMAVLINYDEAIQRQAIELAYQDYEKPTAGIVEQYARNLNDAAMAKAKEEAARESFRKAEAAAKAAEKEDEEEEEIEEEQEPETEEEEEEEDETPPSPPTPSRGGRPSATARALTNPIVREEDLRNAKAQAGRATRKCCRIHQRLIDLGDMDADSTIADFFEKYGPK